jgi:hypothetical protein
MTLAQPSPATKGSLMDPTINSQLLANLGSIMQSHMQDQMLRQGRQADSSAIAHTSYNAAAYRLVASASDPEAAMDYNTASHVPVPQPYIAPGYVSAPQPTATKPS